MPTDTTDTPGAAAASLTTDLAMDAPRAADPTLCADVARIFAEATRDRRGDGIFQAALPAQQWQAFSEWFAMRLAARIGGRYIPKRDDRAVRDAAVWQAFTGRNRDQVMRDFRISRALFYSIMSRKRKA